MRALAALLAGALLSYPISARAQSFLSGVDYSVGPTLSFVEYDPGNPQPISIASGAGIQLSLTHDSLKREIFGKSWDLFDLALMGFGSVVNSQPLSNFGVFSGAVGLCTFSSAICVVGGKHLFSPDGAYANGGWFGGLHLSINLALAPSSPPTGVAQGAAGLVRANTLYLSGG